MNILNKIANGNITVICKTKEEFKKYLNILSVKNYKFGTYPINIDSIDILCEQLFDSKCALRIMRYFNSVIYVPISMCDFFEISMVDFTNIISWEGF